MIWLEIFNYFYDSLFLILSMIFSVFCFLWIDSTFLFTWARKKSLKLSVYSAWRFSFNWFSFWTDLILFLLKKKINAWYHTWKKCCATIMFHFLFCCMLCRFDVILQHFHQPVFWRRMLSFLSNIFYLNLLLS